MLAVALVSMGLAIALIVYLVGSRAAAPAEQAVPAAIGAPAETSVVPMPRSGIDPSAPLPPLYERFGKLAARFTASSYNKSLQRRLDIAGNPRGWAADRVLALKGMGLVIGVAFGVVAGAKNGAWIVFAPIIFGVAGFFLPDVWIRNLGEHRQQDLRLGLPDAIDMMTVCVEAGLGFDAAIARVAINMEGPIAGEFARVLQEMQFGKSRTEALRSLVDRTDVPELRNFVSSLVQSAELGISVGDVLREQSREMRVKRRQRAEEQAQKLPVKILFPLLFCMLPSMFIVVIGPAALKIVHTFGGLNK